MLVDALETGAGAATRQDWPALAKRARLKRAAGQSALLAFLLIVSVPIILPYFWMVVISFTARSGGVSTQVLWTACAVIVPAVLIYSVVHLLAPSPRVRLVAGALSSSPSRRWPATTSRALPFAAAKRSSRACSCCTRFRR